MSEDISNRQRRYLIMMGFRAVCFGITVLLVIYGFGWWAAFPAVFAIFVPQVAVIYANGGREPDNVRGFMEYRPNLPERHAVNRHGGASGYPGGNGYGGVHDYGADLGSGETNGYRGAGDQSEPSDHGESGQAR